MWYKKKLINEITNQLRKTKFSPLPLLGIAFLLCFLPVWSLAQNGIIGSGFTNGWSNSGDIEGFSASAGSSRIYTNTANGTGNQYFRLVRYWSGDNSEYAQGGCTDLSISPETEYSGTGCGSGAWYINVSSTSDNYVIKTPQGSSGVDFIYFRIQGTIQTISSVTSVQGCPGSAETVTATTSGAAALATGHGIYLRYTNNSWSSSTVVEMSHTGSGNYTANIPAGTNTAGATVEYYVFTSGDGMTIDPSDADWYTINYNNNGGSNFSYTVPDACSTGGGDGSWNDAAHWGGSVPSAGDDVVIQHYTSLDQDATVGSLVVAAGGTLTEDGGGRRLSIQNGGTLTNNDTWSSNAIIVDFEGAGTIDGSGAITFNDLELNGALTTSTTPTVNGTLTLNSGGSVTGGINYGTSSTLKYNTGGTYGRNDEWTDTDGSNPGYPHHVILDNNTTFNLKNGTNGNRYIGGDLTINSGSYFDCQDNTGDFTVYGNIVNEGTLDLSTQSGGDLEIYGNWTNTGTYTHNGRSINFTGTQDPQIITETAGEDWQYLHIDKSSGDVQLATDLTISNTWSDNITFDDAGGLDLNDHTINMAVGAYMQQNYVGTVNITNSGGGGTAKIIWPNQMQFQGSNGSKEFYFGTGVTLEFNNQAQNLNQCNIDGTVSIKTSGSFSGSGPSWGSTSTLILDTNDDEYYSAWWPIWSEGSLYNWTIESGTTFRLDSDGTISSSGTVTVNGSIIIHDGSANRDMDWDGDLIIGASGTINMNNSIGADMFLAGDFTCNSGGTFQMDERMMEFNGNGEQIISGDFGANKWDYVNINNSHASEGIQLQTDITINYEMRWMDGYLFLNNSNLTYDSDAINAVASPASSTSHIVTNGTGVFTKQSLGASSAFVFPVGTAAGTFSYFMFETAGDHTADDISVRVESGTCDAGNGWDANTEVVNPEDMVNTTWVITEGTGGGSSGDLNFYWYGSQENGSFTRASSRIYHFTGGEWTDLSFNIRDNGGEPYRVRASAPATFSPFLVGDDMPAVLPVELTSFTGEAIGTSANLLEWTTASEVNNDYFILQASTDGVEFESIAVIDGSGTTSHQTTYDYHHETADYLVYYRLLQVDFDGKVNKHYTIEVGKGYEKSWRLLPNPASQGNHAQLIPPTDQPYGYVIYNVLGEVIEDRMTNETMGNTTLPSLPTGHYLIHIFSGNQQHSKQLIISQ